MYLPGWVYKVSEMMSKMRWDRYTRNPKDSMFFFLLEWHTFRQVTRPTMGFKGPCYLLSQAFLNFYLNTLVSTVLWNLTWQAVWWSSQAHEIWWLFINESAMYLHETHTHGNTEPVLGLRPFPQGLSQPREAWGICCPAFIKACDPTAI